MHQINMPTIKTCTCPTRFNIIIYASLLQHQLDNIISTYWTRTWQNSWDHT